MGTEDQIINQYLNPLLGDLMKQSLDSILEMKENGLINIEEKDMILFISQFIDEAELFYSSIKDTRNLAILSDLKQYILNLAT